MAAAGLFALAFMVGLCLRAAEVPAQTQPTEPTSRVKTFYALLLDTMKQAKRLGPRGRYAKLHPVIMMTFDVSGMMRVAAGAGWERASPAQQASMVDAFLQMMTATYASRFDEYSGENFEVSPAVDQPPGSKLVRTRLIQSNGKTVMLNYLMRNAGDGWRIADVYLDGTISELAARRAEFAAIMKAGGPDALVGSLRQKADQLLGGS